MSYYQDIFKNPTQYGPTIITVLSVHLELKILLVHIQKGITVVGIRFHDR